MRAVGLQLLITGYKGIGADYARNSFEMIVGTEGVGWTDGREGLESVQ